jgi:hypothetical protein
MSDNPFPKAVIRLSLRIMHFPVLLNLCVWWWNHIAVGRYSANGLWQAGLKGFFFK